MVTVDDAIETSASPVVHVAIPVIDRSRRIDLAVLVSPHLLSIYPTTSHFEDDLLTPPYFTPAGKVLFAGCTLEKRADMLERALWRKIPAATKSGAEDVQRLSDQIAVVGATP